MENSRNQKLAKKGRHMRCQNCLEFGHNKKSCKKDKVVNM